MWTPIALSMWCCRGKAHYKQVGWVCVSPYREWIFVDWTTTSGHNIGWIESLKHGASLACLNNKHQLIVPEDNNKNIASDQLTYTLTFSSATFAQKHHPTPALKSPPHPGTWGIHLLHALQDKCTMIHSLGIARSFPGPTLTSSRPHFNLLWPLTSHVDKDIAPVVAEKAFWTWHTGVDPTWESTAMTLSIIITCFCTYQLTLARNSPL